MLISYTKHIKYIIKKLSNILLQFNKQYAYELHEVSTCPVSFKHLLGIKVNGKCQSISCLAEELAADDNFLFGFSPSEIRTISYLAATDKYEDILRRENIKKDYEIIRTDNIDNKKAVIMRHRPTGESITKFVTEFSDTKLIDHLQSSDAYHLGYLAGQEQTMKDVRRLKINSIK